MSKRRHVTPAERTYQARVADALRREATALAAGMALPPRRRHRRREPAVPTWDTSEAEADQLRDFMAKHGAAIAGVVALTRTEGETMAVAMAYRAIVHGEPGAHEKWARLVKQLSTRSV